MPSATITTSVTGDVSAPGLSKSFTVTGGKRTYIEEVIADETTNGEVAFVADVSQVKSFILVATQDVMVETNDGTTPGNTFTLAANVPYIFPRVFGESWNDTEDDAVSTDITALFITNASGAEATFYLECIEDPTV